MNVERAGLSPDWIVGDMDSLDSVQRLAAYPKERVLVYPADKDYTDTELALSLLWEQGCTWAALVGGGGGRVDHLLALRSLFERSPSPDRWITDKEDIYALGQGQSLHIEARSNSIVSVFPLGSDPWRITSSGLKWPLDGLRWDRGFFGISNRALGTVSVESKVGRFLIVTER
jgi:thiamine pyrophosphokinase